MGKYLRWYSKGSMCKSKKSSTSLLQEQQSYHHSNLPMPIQSLILIHCLCEQAVQASIEQLVTSFVLSWRNERTTGVFILVSPIRFRRICNEMTTPLPDCHFHRKSDWLYLIRNCYISELNLLIKSSLVCSGLVSILIWVKYVWIEYIVAVDTSWWAPCDNPGGENQSYSKK